MKPATLGLFTFLASLLIYSVIGIILAGILDSNSFGLVNQVYNYELAIAIAIVASIATGYMAWMFEKD
jgi:hypothetical protein